MQIRRIAYTDQYLELRGLRFHFVDYGGMGEPLIALPGLIQTARAFDPIAALLAPRVRVLALDFRGRGGSQWGPPERYRIDQYLKDLMAFIEALQLKRLALIGTSLGGFVARLYATAHPDRVTRLVLNDCAIGGSPAAINRVSMRPSKSPDEFADLPEAVAWFRADRPGLDRLDPEILDEWVSHYLAPAGNGRLRFNCDPAVIKLSCSAAAQIASLKKTDIEGEVAWEHARRLTMPVLMLRGTLSDLISPQAAERMAHVVPTARVADIAGVGHSPTLYELEAQAALAAFFEVTDPAISADLETPAAAGALT